MYILKAKSVAQASAHAENSSREFKPRTQAERPSREAKTRSQDENRDPLKCFTFQGVSAE